MTEAIIHIGNVRSCLQELDEKSVDTCVTSPPYFGLRNYGHPDQMGLEETPQKYVEALVEIFREVRRVLKDEGTVWLNIGDSYASMRDSKATPDSLRTGEGTKVAYSPNRDPKKLKEAGLKHKDLIGIPWRVALALQEDGWYLRSDIIWSKPNPMPESVKDRPTKAHEYVFLLSKSPQYYYDSEAVREDQAPNTAKELAGRKNLDNKGTHGDIRSDLARSRDEYVPEDGKRNRRSVWHIATKPFAGAHFAVMPEALVEPCVLAGCPEGGLVLDPFTGSGTVAVVAMRNKRRFVGIELNRDYVYNVFSPRVVKQISPLGPVNITFVHPYIEPHVEGQKHA